MNKIYITLAFLALLSVSLKSQHHFVLDTTNSPLTNFAHNSIVSFGDTIFFTDNSNLIFKYSFNSWKADTLPTINTYSPHSKRLIKGRDNKLYVLTDTAIYVKNGAIWQVKMLYQARFKSSYVCPDKFGNLYFFDKLDPTKFFTYKNNILDSVSIPSIFRPRAGISQFSYFYDYSFAIDDSLNLWFAGQNGLIKYNGSSFSLINDGYSYRTLEISDNNELWALRDSTVITYSAFNLMRKSKNGQFTVQFPMFHYDWDWNYFCKIPFRDSSAFCLYTFFPIPYNINLVTTNGISCNGTYISQFTHFPADSSITDMISDNNGNIWYIGHEHKIYFLRVIKNKISGRVFFDQNSNGVKDANELYIQGANVKLMPANQIVVSDINGYYEFSLKDTSGIYTISSTYVNPWLQTTLPLNYVVTQTHSNQIDSGIVFGFNSVPHYDVRISGAPNAFRSGQQGVYHLVVKNTGSLPIDSVKLSLNFDNYLNFGSSSPVQNSITGNQIVWWIDSMQVFETKHFYAIFPITTSMTFGTTLHSKAWISNSLDTNQSNDTVDLLHAIMGPMDPNNKLHATKFSDNLAFPGELIKYTINFQNCGNDTAFKVVLRDTLHNDFDINTFCFVGASHGCSYTINSNQELVVSFLNCNLPDSSTNHYGSMGFFNYSIQLKSTTLVDSVITNTAYIYFDFNSAVVTNESKIPTFYSTVYTPDASNFIRISPNPVNEILTLEIVNKERLNSGTVEIFNLTGSKIFTQKLSNISSKTEINFQTFKDGLYFYKVLFDDGTTQSGKIIKLK